MNQNSAFLIETLKFEERELLNLLRLRKPGENLAEALIFAQETSPASTKTHSHWCLGETVSLK